MQHPILQERAELEEAKKREKISPIGNLSGKNEKAEMSAKNEQEADSNLTTKSPTTDPSNAASNPSRFVIFTGTGNKSYVTTHLDYVAEAIFTSPSPYVAVAIGFLFIGKYPQYSDLIHITQSVPLSIPVF